MTEKRTATFRMFGCLHTARCERGEPTTVDVEVPDEGIAASEVALSLGLALDLIEGVFCNATVYPLTRLVRPGDRVAFVPYGTPGPHRVNLGLYKAGLKDANAE